MIMMKNLRVIRKEAGYSMREVGERIGVSESAISQYETGKREPDFDTLLGLSELFCVTTDWLLGRGTRGGAEEPSRRDTGADAAPGLPCVPLLGSIACGAPILAAQNIEEHIGVPPHIHADFALRCKGDSMVNARIYDGDVVYIRQQPTVENGEIAAVLVDDEATLKRVYQFPAKLVLNPENPAYEPLVFMGDELERIRILGRAVAFTSAL